MVGGGGSFSETTSGSEPPLRVLQVSTYDVGGGAEQVAWNLFDSYRRRGVRSWLAVGRKRTADADVLPFPSDHLDSLWGLLCLAGANAISLLAGKVPGAGMAGSFLRLIGQPQRVLDKLRGREDFHFPGTSRLLDLTPEKPDIVHCHNLHGSYFDLHFLPRLSRTVPTVLTLQDAWLLSGHCAHSFACDRWLSGCGHCPDLAIYPAVWRDGTADNWQRKRAIFGRSRLYVATPCRWLLDRVLKSVLAPGVVEGRVIPNGVDLSLFHPADRGAVRSQLGIPPGAKVLLFAALSNRKNPFKDYQTLEKAVGRVAEALADQPILFVSLGGGGRGKRIGRAEVQFIPYQKTLDKVIQYYQAADLYLHAAKADTFPNSVLEALACGTPVVATAVSGIPEQIRHLAPAPENGPYPGWDKDRATGVLVPPGDAEGMAAAISQLLSQDSLRQQLGRNGAADARARFSLERQVDTYLAWYQEIVARREDRRPDR